MRVRRAETDTSVLRGYAETRYGAKSWSAERRVAARIEATTQGLDIRYVVTSLTHGSAEWVYHSLYCARGQAENLIKLHKGQLASDRTSCRSPLANQVRLVLHTAALMSGFKDGTRIFSTPAGGVGRGSDAGVQGRRRDRWTSVDLL